MHSCAWWLTFHMRPCSAPGTERSDQGHQSSEGQEPWMLPACGLPQQHRWGAGPGCRCGAAGVAVLLWVPGTCISECSKYGLASCTFSCWRIAGVYGDYEGGWVDER